MRMEMPVEQAPRSGGHQSVSVTHLQCLYGLNQPWVPGAQIRASACTERLCAQCRWKSQVGRGLCAHAAGHSALWQGNSVRAVREELPVACSTLGLRVLDGGRNLLSHLSEG